MKYKITLTETEIQTNIMIALSERDRRGYEYNTAAMNAYFTAEDYEQAEKITVPFLYKMTDRYLKQCLYNLQEKYDCGGVTESEWQLIYNKFGGLL